jgi:hypothetical protein
VKEQALKEARRIRDELKQVETIVSHSERDWEKFVLTGDDAYLKAVAYDLHGFYTGIERIFESVVDTVDGHFPQGDSWHKELLLQMGKEIKGVRPALLSGASLSLLDQYMRFRHRIRNIYSFNLIPERVKALVENLPDVFQRVSSEILDFAQFLENL